MVIIFTYFFYKKGIKNNICLGLSEVYFIGLKGLFKSGSLYKFQ
jgi:hypothetical protein